MWYYKYIKLKQILLGREVHEMKSICLFNHKGGVSKTTTTFNLGWMLANKGYKVVIVDLDSQCNLTGQVFGYTGLEDDVLERFYNDRNYFNIGAIVDALLMVRPVDGIVSSGARLYKTLNPNMSLLAGHIRVAELDSQLTIALRIGSAIPMVRSIVGDFPKVLREIAKSCDADFLLIDVSPNVGGLNEVVVMSSDYFIVPTSPDFFCLQAVGSFAGTIKQWHEEIDEFKKRNGFNTKNYSVHNKPQFLGVIQQRFRPRSGRPASSFQQWIDKMDVAVNQKLVPKLEDVGCFSTSSKQKLLHVLDSYDLKPYNLAYISDFNSLIAISQLVQKPIFELTKGDITTNANVFGRSLETMQESVDKFNQEFDDLSDRVIKLVE